MNAPAIAQPTEKPERILFEPGWYKDIPSEVYHRSGGTSSTRLKILLDQTGAHFEYARTHPIEPSSAMEIGSALHALVLQPDQFESEFAVAPEGLNLRTNAGKDVMAQFMADNDGKTILKADQFAEARAMADRVMAHPIAAALLEDVIAESSIYWWYRSLDRDDDTKYREMMKVRPDAISRAHPVVLDIKTTRDASFTGFSKIINDYNYHVSAAMYLEGVNQCKPLLEELGFMAYLKFIFICVENFPPYEVAVYELSEDFLQIGKIKYRLAMQKLADVRAENWPGYPEAPRIIEPPAWAHKGHVV